MPMIKRDAYVLAGLRRIWRWETARRNCLKATHCASCKEAFPEKNAISQRKKIKKHISYADHIDPACPIEGYKDVNGHPDWNQVYDRMFVGEDKLQALCGPCHAAKTKAENAERRKARD
jgi:5-methylcytosine-specific restriction endonuclease McrA